MASKAARNRRRLEIERQRLASLEGLGSVHTRCSDVTIAELDALLAQTHELLGRIVAHGARARAIWPQVPAAYELRATIEEIAAVATSSRAKLAAASERARRLQRSGVHVHLCGDLAVRMVPLAARGSMVTAPRANVDDDQTYGGDEIGASSPDDLPF
jgi:hypothetical protein